MELIQRRPNIAGLDFAGRLHAAPLPGVNSKPRDRIARRIGHKPLRWIGSFIDVLTLES
jgi:hypothetical protein